MRFAAVLFRTGNVPATELQSFLNGELPAWLDGLDPNTLGGSEQQNRFLLSTTWPAFAHTRMSLRGPRQSLNISMQWQLHV